MKELAFLAMMFFSCVCHAQDVERPPIGAEADVTRKVRLMAAMPKPCLSAAFDEVTIVFERNPIEQLAVGSKGHGLPSASAHRARTLLANILPAKDRHGCNPIAIARMPRDTLYPIFNLLEHGLAAMFMTNGGPSIASVAIRYVGSERNGYGSISVGLIGAAKPFLVLGWWES